MSGRRRRSAFFPYTTLFRSERVGVRRSGVEPRRSLQRGASSPAPSPPRGRGGEGHRPEQRPQRRLRITPSPPRLRGGEGRGEEVWRRAATLASARSLLTRTLSATRAWRSGIPSG